MDSPVDPAVARARFAVWVDRALKDARTWGATDRSIARDSGVATSTFHRWRTGQGKELPKLPQVRAFAEATGASLEDALKTLGMTQSGPTPTPEPPLPDAVRTIMRRLADPNTPADERDFIVKSLEMLADRATNARRGEQRSAS